MAVHDTAESFNRALENHLKQVRFAAAKALTETAKEIQAEVKAEMQRKFDRPTPFALNSVYVKPATKQDLRAEVGIKDQLAAKAAKSAAEMLRHEFTGGKRIYKRMEGAFRRIGLLSSGQIIVPAAGAELDQYGNMKRSQVVQLLSYFQAFGEQGYKANSTALGRKRLAKYGKTQSGYKTIGGKVYFASRGIGFYNGKPSHLPAGIWVKTGIHGVDVKPVVLFVRAPTYKGLIDINAIAKKVVQGGLQQKFSANLARAIASS